MHEVWTLLSLELRSLYGINRFLHTRDRQEKNRYRLLGGVWLLVIGLVVSYVAGLVVGLCSLGLGEIVPAYLVVLASLLILAFGVFTAGNRIFGQMGYEILAAMPLKSGFLVLSRFLGLYLEHLVLALLVMLPGTVAYGICRGPSWGFYLAALVGTLFIPAIPLVASTLLGTLILALSARMKHKSMAQTALSVLLVVAVLVGSFRMPQEVPDLAQLSALAETVGSLFAQIYPPALWLGTAMLQSNGRQLLLFVLVSFGVMALAVLGVSRYFHAIVRRLLSFHAKHSYKIGALESRSLLKALYLREAKRYFSSSIYVTNTILGPILGLILSAAVCVTGLDGIQGLLMVDLSIAEYLPFLLAGVFCMMTTTATAISMEGRQFWVVQSLPIPTKALLDSKILLNVSLMLPFYLVSVAALAIGTRPGPGELLWLGMIPASVMAFSVVFGITVNLKFHSFHWEKEETVVKQSLPAALGGFAGPLLALALGVATFLSPEGYRDGIKGILCLLVLVATALMYRRNNRAVLSAL